MDSGKVLIVNLSEGRNGEDTSGLLGSLLINSLQIAAMSRAGVVGEERQHFCLFVDEFQNFATESFATILSEARKYLPTVTHSGEPAPSHRSKNRLQPPYWVTSDHS